MGVVHFLNVNEGDCALIQHNSGHNTVIDISNGPSGFFRLESALGNHQQKYHQVNPVQDLKDFGVDTVFRFILTHPDMDHMDGISSLFDSFSVLNFWDTQNTKVMDSNSDFGKYDKEDWDFYQKIRKSKTSPKVLNLLAGSKGAYYNETEDGKSGADGLYILAPTKDLIDDANETKEYNDCSYVILYRVNGKKIIFSGDSAEKTWNYILGNHKNDVTDVDVLIAPHHGRKTGGNRDYLDILNPKLTLFGNAESQYLNYNAWNRRGLDHITNNQANCIILNADAENGIDVYVTYEKFAKKRNPDSVYNTQFNAWYLITI